MSHIAYLMNNNSIYAAKSPDRPKHQPHFDSRPVIWRGGQAYVVVGRGKLVPVCSRCH